jgi:hypothetical protein
MTLTQIFELLVAVAAVAPQVLAKVMELADLISGVIPQPAQVLELDAEQLALERKLVDLLAPANALFDGSRIRALAAFLAEHPELVTLLKTFLK